METNYEWKSVDKYNLPEVYGPTPVDGYEPLEDE